MTIKQKKLLKFKTSFILFNLRFKVLNLMKFNGEIIETKVKVEIILFDCPSIS